MRYISLCASSDDVTSEVASILAKFVRTPGISSAGNKILRYLRFLRRRLYISQFELKCVYILDSKIAAMNKLYLSVQKNGEAKSRMLKSSSCPDLFQLHHTIKTNIHDMSIGNAKTIFWNTKYILEKTRNDLFI